MSNSPMSPALEAASRNEAETSNYIRHVIESVLWGKTVDSYDVDRLSWLSASLASSEYALAHMAQATRCGTNFDLLDFARARVSVEGMFLEFGVYSGSSVNHIAAIASDRPVYGFDSFEGLPEDWRPGYVKGSFARPTLPEVRGNVQLIRGWFDRTLPGFCEEHKGEQVAFLHVDCDLYSSTQTVFASLRELIVPGTIIVFDEYFNYPGWQQHEMRAFQEYCQSSGTTYKYIALVPGGQQVAVRITG